jgi:hypothetical protein
MRLVRFPAAPPRRCWSEPQALASFLIPQWCGVKEWSYALDDVVRAHLPAEWTDGKRWLTRRLNRKELRGRGFGRTWRMTDSDIAFMLGKFANFTEDQDAVEAQAPSEATSVADGLSARSARRLRRVE